MYVMQCIHVMYVYVAEHRVFILAVEMELSERQPTLLRLEVMGRGGWRGVLREAAGDGRARSQRGPKKPYGSKVPTGVYIYI